MLTAVRTRYLLSSVKTKAFTLHILPLTQRVYFVLTGQGILAFPLKPRERTSSILVPPLGSQNRPFGVTQLPESEIPTLR